MTLSDDVAHFGLEHHESSDDRTSERSLIDESERVEFAGLLPHEFVHSWNGKYRRPAGLATPDYQQPMKDDLLWVYEGLTEYLGDVLTARSELLTANLAREDLAFLVARYENRPGATGVRCRTPPMRLRSFTTRRTTGRTGGAGRIFTKKATCCGWMWTRRYAR